MFKYFIICNIFFISLIKATTIHPISIATNGLISPKPSVIPKNSTAEFVVSEGESVSSSKPTLEEDKHSVLLTKLEKELSVNKASVVARKGVLNEDDKSQTDIELNENSLKEVTTSINNTVAAEKVPTKLNKTVISSNETTSNDTKIHKPLILSSDVLGKINAVNNDANIRSIKVQAAKVSNSHPEMIMPIVITILVVPMFAVLGYLALKRGQEAWKNRHYKRMDFLLDGMYND